MAELAGGYWGRGSAQERWTSSCHSQSLGVGLGDIHARGSYHRKSWRLSLRMILSQSAGRRPSARPKGQTDTAGPGHLQLRVWGWFWSHALSAPDPHLGDEWPGEGSWRENSLWLGVHFPCSKMRHSSQTSSQSTHQGRVFSHLGRQTSKRHCPLHQWILSFIPRCFVWVFSFFGGVHLKSKKNVERRNVHVLSPGKCANESYLEEARAKDDGGMGWGQGE